jgi:hypothetical protein
MDKVQTTKEITDFIQFNSVDIAQLKNDDVDIYNAFNGLLLAIDKQYGSGVLVAESINKIKKKSSLVDTAYVQDLLLDFEKNGNRIKFLPANIENLALDNQVGDGNKRDSEKDLALESYAGNFDWSGTPQGEGFWTSILEGDWGVYFDEQEKWENIENKKLFKATQKMKYLPESLRKIAIENQEKEVLTSGRPNDSKDLGSAFDWASTSQGATFWTQIKEGNWDLYFSNEAKWQNKATTKKTPTKTATKTTTPVGTFSNWKPTWKADGNRPSPTRSASAGKEGEFGIGNDGYWYVITKNKANVQQWKKSAQTFKTIVNSFKNISAGDLGVYADQLKYSMVGLDKSDDIYKELEQDLIIATAIIKA